MTFLRRKISCFYCGKTSDTSWKPGLRSFHCRTCDARNYLDNDGGITDPPSSEASAVSPKAQYAQLSLGSRSPSPMPVVGSSGSIFCHTCTSNQQFVTQALAEYLPSMQDPRYHEYENNLPDYKRQLEARYPQVCTACEPLVERQIRLAGYTARSDYVRRMNDKSRRSSRPRFWTQRRLIGITAGLVWLFVALAHTSWNVAGLLLCQDDGLQEISKTTNRSCIGQILNLDFLQRECMNTIDSRLPWLFVLNVLTIWWNPILLRSTRRARGVGEFYRLQTLLFMLRCLELYVLRSHSILNLDDELTKAIYAMMLVINLAVTAVSVYTAQPMPHLVRFHKDIEPLEVDKTTQSFAAKASDNAASSRTKQENASQSPVFPVKGLMPSVRQAAVNSVQHSRSSLGSQVSSNDIYESPDAMDIDTPDSVRRSEDGETLFYRDSISTRVGIRPLPKPEFRSPVPLQLASTRQLRSRTRQDEERSRAKSNLQLNWDLGAIVNHDNEDDTFTIGGDDDSEESLSQGYERSFAPASARRKTTYHFDEAKFHATEEDTGLEGMLGFFGFGDDPLNTGVDKFENEETKLNSVGTHPSYYMPGISSQKQDKEGLTKSKPIRLSNSVSVLTMPVFAVSLVGLNIWHPFESMGFLESVRTACLIWCSAIGLLRIVDALDPSRQIWEFSNILVFAIEAGLGLLLSMSCVSESAQNTSAEVTATGPSEPLVMPDTTSPEIPSSVPGVTEDASDALTNTVGMNPVSLASVLLVWVFLQELAIVYRYLNNSKQR